MKDTREVEHLTRAVHAATESLAEWRQRMVVLGEVGHRAFYHPADLAQVDFDIRTAQTRAQAREGLAS